MKTITLSEILPLLDEKNKSRVLSFLSKDCSIITSMAFEKKAATKKLNDLQIIIAEHLYKLIFVAAKKDINHWYKELNSWRKTLSVYNNGKKSKNNYNKTVLWEKLYVEPLGTSKDRLTLNTQLLQEGYSTKRFTAESLTGLKNLINKFIVCVLNNEPFSNKQD